jgi:hypothetical protein
LLPILGGFLGAYCEFVRWFTRRQLAMMMTSGDGMQIAVRFMLALVVTVIVAMISQAIPLGQLTSFLPFIFAFLVGYLASHLFSALDTLITAPSSIVLAQRMERATRNVIEQTQATQITAFKGSVEEVIGRTLGVPNVVNYAGQIGIDLRDEGEHSVLETRAANAAGSVPAMLIAGATYKLLIVIGRSIENLPIVEDLSVKDGEEAVDVSFEIEVESILLPSRRVTESCTPTDKEPWTHRVTLHAPATQDSTKTEQIWVMVRQRGITYQSIAILAQIVSPEGGGLQQERGEQRG